MSDTITFQYNRKELERKAAENGFDSIQKYLEWVIEKNKKALLSAQKPIQSDSDDRTILADDNDT